MSGLTALHAKLDKIAASIGNKQSTAKPEKPPTAEEKDEERLREVEAKIAEVTDLLASNADRDTVDRHIAGHRARVRSADAESKPRLRVFHDHGGKRIQTTRRTQAKMQLAGSLQTRLRLAQHATDLEHALHVLVQEQVEILERQLGRKSHKKE